MQQNTNAWNEIFKEKGNVFTEPHEDLPSLITELKQRGAKTILDLGSGSGRHVVYLARNGFEVFGIDNSPEGIGLTKKWLSAENLSATIQFVCG